MTLSTIGGFAKRWKKWLPEWADPVNNGSGAGGINFWPFMMVTMHAHSKDVLKSIFLLIYIYYTLEEVW